MHDDVPHACRFRQRHDCTGNCFGKRCQARFERRNVWSTGAEFDSLVSPSLVDESGTGSSKAYLCALPGRRLHAVDDGWVCVTPRLKLFDQTLVDLQHSQLHFVRVYGWIDGSLPRIQERITVSPHWGHSNSWQIL
jgi:hypothetical protein